MRVAAAGLGSVLILFVLLDAFETVLLPRRVSRKGRFATAYLASLWSLWLALARRIRSNRRREGMLAFYALASLILLLVVWAAGLIVGFALLHWGLGSRLHGAAEMPTFGTMLYLSGTTFFTLGLGDVAPASASARMLTVIEAGSGIAFLALVIGYLPVLYRAFSRREVRISMLDEWAGSPPTAVEILRRSALPGGASAKERLLVDWEEWCAELLESHISYPMLGYFRSQHDNQSWLAAITAVLDTCALTMTILEDDPPFQAGLTFAIARHAVVDLSQTLATAPTDRPPDRLPEGRLRVLRTMLEDAGLRIRADEPSMEALAELRGMYEPYVSALADHLLMALPPLVPDLQPRPDWQVTAWDLPDWEDATKRSRAPDHRPWWRRLLRGRPKPPPEHEVLPQDASAGLGAHPERPDGEGEQRADQESRGARRL
jgi:hypothetical protein